MAAITTPTFATLLNGEDYRTNSFAHIGQELAKQLITGFTDTNKRKKITSSLYTQGSIQAEKEQEKRVAEYKASIAKNQKIIVSRVLKTALFTAVAVGAFIACGSGLGFAMLGALQNTAWWVALGKVIGWSAVVGAAGGTALSANNFAKIADRATTWAFKESALNAHEEGSKSATIAHNYGEEFDKLMEQIATQQTKNLFGSDKAQNYIKQIKTGEHIELPMVTEYSENNKPDGYGRFNFETYPYLDPLAIDPNNKKAYLRIKPGMVNQLLTALAAGGVPLADFKFEPAVDATPQKLAKLNSDFPDADGNLVNCFKYIALAQGGMPSVRLNLSDLHPSLGALGSVKIAVPLTSEQQEQAITATGSADMGAYVTSMKKAAVMEGLLRYYGNPQDPTAPLQPLTPEQRINLIWDIKDGKFDGILGSNNTQVTAVMEALNSIVSPTMPEGPLTNNPHNYQTVKTGCKNYCDAINSLFRLHQSIQDNDIGTQINCMNAAGLAVVNNPQFTRALSTLPPNALNAIIKFKRTDIEQIASTNPTTAQALAAAQALGNHTTLYSHFFSQFQQTRAMYP